MSQPDHSLEPRSRRKPRHNRRERSRRRHPLRCSPHRSSHPGRQHQNSHHDPELALRGHHAEMAFGNELRHPSPSGTCAIACVGDGCACRNVCDAQLQCSRASKCLDRPVGSLASDEHGVHRSLLVGRRPRLLVSRVRTLAYQARSTLTLSRPEDLARHMITVRGMRIWAIAREETSTSAEMHVRMRIFDASGAALEGMSLLDTNPLTYSVPRDLIDVTKGVQLHVECYGYNPDRATSRSAGLHDCYPLHQLPFEVVGVETTLSEDVEPTSTIEGGTLLDGGAISGTRTLRYAAADAQSGVAQVQALLGDTVVATRDTRPQVPTLTSPCVPPWSRAS